MVLTDDFLDGAVEAAQDNVEANFTHGAVGTGASGGLASDDSLDIEKLRKARADFTKSAVSGGSGSATVSLFINSTEANGQDLSELGFFDASSGGEMQQRDVFSSISKNNSIELFVDVDVNISASQA